MALANGLAGACPGKLPFRHRAGVGNDRLGGAEVLAKRLPVAECTRILRKGVGADIGG